MSVLFWVTIGVPILAAVIFIRWLLVAKAHGLSEMGAGDRINLIVNAVMFVLTVISIAIALAAFHDSKTSGDEQKIALQASRESLQDVVGALKTQTALLNDAQTLLQSQLEVSRQQQKATMATNSVLLSSKRTLKSQLDIATEQNKREVERLSKKPQLHLTIHAGSKFLQEEQFSETLTVNINDFNSLSIVVTNIGDAALSAPNISLMAIPQEVAILPLGMVYADGLMHNAFQFTGQSLPQSLEPFSQARTPYYFPFRISPKEGITEALLIVRIFGSNMRAKEGLIHLKIVWPTATP
jgi:hypothetical protein